VLETLFQRFWHHYLAGSGDREMLRVLAPLFLAFRCLVMANPAWYPELPDTVRQKLLIFVLTVLTEDEFDPQKVNHYFESKTPGIRGVGHWTSRLG
jgi:hypothetical protein